MVAVRYPSMRYKILLSLFKLIVTVLYVETLMLYLCAQVLHVVHIIFCVCTELILCKIFCIGTESFLFKIKREQYMYVCLYIILTPRRIASFFKGSPLSVPPHKPLSTGSGSILGAGASRASPGISIGRTAIVVVCTPYIWSCVSVLLYR